MRNISLMLFPYAENLHVFHEVIFVWDSYVYIVFLYALEYVRRTAYLLTGNQMNQLSLIRRDNAMQCETGISCLNHKHSHSLDSSIHYN